MLRNGVAKSSFAIGALAALIALFLPLFAGVAAAQEPSISTDPASVPEAGEHELVVSGENFTAGNSLFLLPCVAPDGDPDAINGQEDCDISDLTPVTVGDDGTFETTVTYDIVEDFAIAAGDAGQTEAAAVLVPIDAEGGDDGDDDTTTTTEAPAGGDDTDDGELADTGWATNLLVATGVLMLAGGYFATRAERRMS